MAKPDVNRTRMYNTSPLKGGTANILKIYEVYYSHSLCHKYLLSSFSPANYTHPYTTQDQTLILQYSISISSQNITPLELYIWQTKKTNCMPTTCSTDNASTGTQYCQLFTFWKEQG